MSIFLHSYRNGNKQYPGKYRRDLKGMGIVTEYKEAEKESGHIDDNKHDRKDKITEIGFLRNFAAGRKPALKVVVLNSVRFIGCDHDPQ